MHRQQLVVAFCTLGTRPRYRLEHVSVLACSLRLLGKFSNLGPA